MIVVIPVHNQALSLPQVLEGYLGQTKKPSHIVVALDRCSDDSVGVVNIYAPRFEAIDVKLIAVEVPNNSTKFSAGITRDFGLAEAEKYGDGPFLFTDGDCIPSFSLVEEHSRVMEGQQSAALCCGLRYDTWLPPAAAELPLVSADSQDDVRNCASHLKGLVTGVIDRLCINPEVLQNSWIAWSCNFSMNAAAVSACRFVNALLTQDEDRVFSSAFDGRWGGEDGFVGLTVARLGGQVIMLSDKSSVKHIWHPRGHTDNAHLSTVADVDYALKTLINQRRIDSAPVTKLVFDRQPPNAELFDLARHLVSAELPPHLQEVADLFPKDSIYLAVLPLMLSMNTESYVSEASRSLLSKDSPELMRTLINRAVENIRKAQVLVAPDGKLVLNNMSDLGFEGK